MHVKGFFCLFTTPRAAIYCCLFPSPSPFLSLSLSLAFTLLLRCRRLSTYLCQIHLDPGSFGEFDLFSNFSFSRSRNSRFWRTNLTLVWCFGTKSGISRSIPRIRRGNEGFVEGSGVVRHATGSGVWGSGRGGAFAAGGHASTVGQAGALGVGSAARLWVSPGAEWRRGGRLPYLLCRQGFHGPDWWVQPRERARLGVDGERFPGERER